jgi:PAS domain S-box-containing protein
LTRSAQTPVLVADVSSGSISPTPESDGISEQLLNRMFEDSPIAQARESLAGRYLQVNEAMCRLTGYTRRELMSLDFQTVTHPDELEGNLGKWERLLRGEITEYAIEKRYLKKDGTWAPVLVNVSLVRNFDGSPAYGMTVVQDLAERELARRVQLESEAKSRFLATMSHELRTPLNSILGFSELLLSGSGRTDEAGRERYLNHIHNAGQHLLQMINEVLDLAKVQSGELTFDLEPVRLGAAVDAAVTQLMPQLAAKQLRIVTEDAPAAIALADGRRVHQVLLNLISNAIKFTPEGGSIRLRVSDGELAVGFEVSDTGIGIPADRLDDVFQPFTQVESGNRRSRDGTGLGLPVSRSLVEKMGGTLEAESVVGQGSTFTVLLPRARGRAA